jgi:hypothetical protein
MKTPDHMAGIDALPRAAKQQVYYRNGVAVPVNYGPGGNSLPIDPALRQRLLDTARHPATAKPPPPQAVRDTLRAQLDARVAELKAQGYGTARFDKLNAAINQQLQKMANQAVADKAPKHSTLVSQVPSTCLASLTYSIKDEIATAEFYRGGQVVYDFPMSKSEFIDWVSAQEGIGRYGNSEVFD